MLYVAAATPATVQLSALKCDFITSGINSLVVNKLTRIEIYEVTEEPAGIRLVLEIPIWSTITALVSFKRPDDETSTLLVLTTSLQLFTLTYSPTIPHIITSSTVSILEPYARLSDVPILLIDPLYRCILVHAYSGLIKVIPFSMSKSKKSKDAGIDLTRGYNVRLSSLNVSGMEFLDFKASDPIKNTDDSDDSDEEEADAPEEMEQDEGEEDVKGPGMVRILLPSIAVIFGDHLGRRMLDSYSVDLIEKELISGPIPETVMTDPGTELLIPVGVDGQEGEEGVLVLGEESIKWVGVPPSASSLDKGKGKGKVVESGTRNVTAKMPVGMITAWTAVEGQLNRFLLGDIYGKLFLLEVLRNGVGEVIDLNVKDLGDTSSPTSFVHLFPSLIYLSSRFADSQLVRLPPSVASTLSSDSNSMAIDDEAEADGIQLVASLASLAPILDCCVVEAEGGGASHVVTCSGAYKGGSLRVVRQGVGLSELANLEMENIQRIFSLKKSTDDDELLVLSSFNETRILTFNAPSEDEEVDEIEEIDIPAFVPDKSTLLAGTLGTLLIQVTTDGIGFTNADLIEEGKWSYEGGTKKVTLGAMVKDYVVLAIEGGILVLLKAEGGAIVQVGTKTLSNEIACLDVTVIGTQTVLAVGVWTAQTVSLFSLPDFTPLSSQILDTDFLIRSVLVATFVDKSIHLFVGLGDGTLTSFIITHGESLEILESSKKTVTLGSRPLVMCAFDSKGATNVFVSSDRPTVISRSGGKLVYSSVNLKNINAVVAFNSSTYPSSLALASPTELRIGRIDDIQRVDIRAIPLEDDEPRRIAHDPVTKTYGVVCLRRDVNRVTGTQDTVGMLKIFDDESFEVLADIPMEPLEEGQSIVVLTTSESTSYVVGTTYVKPDESEPTSGRLLVFAQKEGRTFEQTNSIAIAGSPYALASLSDNHVAAAINSVVEVFSVDPVSHLLVPVAKWGGAFISLNLVSCPDNTLLVGDAMRSVTLLHFSQSPYKLEEVARDYEAHYMSAVESIRGLTTTAVPSSITADSTDTPSVGPLPAVGGEFIGAETDFNLFTVLKENTTNARSMADEYSFVPRATFHLGEMVSKFRHGSLVQIYGDVAGAAAPQLVFATSAGSVGVIVELDAESSKTLSDLERNMRNVVAGVGGLKQDDWRAFKSERKVLPSAGFVDGDFVERFLELNDQDVEKVMNGGSEAEKMKVTKEALSQLVEELSRMH